MVVCAVICEPVSIAIPWYQGILGEIREFQHLRPPCKPEKTAGKRGFFRGFLFKSSRENLRRTRETLHDQQGSTPRRPTTSSPRCGIRHVRPTILTILSTLPNRTTSPTRRLEPLE